jgi:hypothetical protein
MQQLPSPVVLTKGWDQLSTKPDIRQCKENCELAEEAKQAADASARRAAEFADQAHDAQQRINRHNVEVSSKFFFSRPKGWREFGNSSVMYRGYCTTDSDGRLVPHGEGEQSFPSGNYMCGQFNMGVPHGLYEKRFAAGGSWIGHLDHRTGPSFMVCRVPWATYSGRLENPENRLDIMKVGAIFYPSGASYFGYTTFVTSIDAWAPSGFGSFEVEQFTFKGFFEDGVATGLGELDLGRTRYYVGLENGRIVAQVKG